MPVSNSVKSGVLNKLSTAAKSVRTAVSNKVKSQATPVQRLFNLSGTTMTGERAKAHIVLAGSMSDTLTCQYNPSEFVIAQDSTAGFKAHSIPPTSKDLKRNIYPNMEFTGLQAREMRVDLFFDAFEITRNGAASPAELGAGSAETGLSAIINRLWNLTEPGKPGRATVKGNAEKLQIHRPPKVIFVWGKSSFGPAFITKLSVRYVLFAPNGAPIRAIASVTFTGAGDMKKEMHQNPTSEGLTDVTMREVMPGDTLALIAHQEYGNPFVWRRIADANSIENPLALRVGQTLRIP